MRLSAQITEVDPLKVPAAVANPPTAVTPTMTPTSTFPAVLDIFNIFSPYIDQTCTAMGKSKYVTLEEL